MGGAGKSGWSVSFSVCLDRHCCPHCSVPNAGSCIRLTAKRRERASICMIKQEVSDASGTVTLTCLKTVDHIRVCAQRCSRHQGVSDTSRAPWTGACQGPVPHHLPEFATFWRYAEILGALFCFSNLCIIQYGHLNWLNSINWIKSHWLNCANNHKAEYVCWVNKTFQSRSPENWSQSIFKYCLSPSSQVSVCFFKKCPTSCSLHLWSEFTTGKRDEIVKYEIWHLWGCILAPSTYSGTHNMKDVNRFSSMIYWRQLDSSIDVTQFTYTLLKKLLSKNTPTLPFFLPVYFQEECLIQAFVWSLDSVSQSSSDFNRNLIVVVMYAYSFSVVLFSPSVTPDSSRPHELQHARLPCPSLSPRVCSNSCPLSRWYHPTISFSFLPALTISQHQGLFWKTM